MEKSHVNKKGAKRKQKRKGKQKEKVDKDKKIGNNEVGEWESNG